ncbi:uL15 family ribosomal protein [Nonomuraea dietziae]|uniref:uL15 family ribosomal protein n=1 Tax=Nonomuraea dietziae TaxID=65515 RepID=UPI003CD0A649
MTDKAPLKIHDLRPAKGANKAKVRRSWRGRQGQDGRSRYQGHESRTTVPLGFEGGQVPLQRRLPTQGLLQRAVQDEPTRSSTWTRSVTVPRGWRCHRRDADLQGAVRKNQPVKVLGTGEISVAVNVQAHAFSCSAKEKIAAAGGSVTSCKWHYSARGSDNGPRACSGVRVRETAGFLSCSPDLETSDG